MEGFEILGVEINQEIADLYKHPVICEDIHNLDPKKFKGYDLIVGSPPCRDFSSLTYLGDYLKWKDPPNPERGLNLVKTFLKFVNIAEPNYWLMENVPGLEKHLGIKSRLKTKLEGNMRRCFWGNFPAFLIPYSLKKRNHNYGFSGKYRSWERAKIPLPVAKALGTAIRNSLMGLS